MSLIDGFLAEGSLWLIGLGLLLAMMIAAQLGAQLRKRMAPNARDNDDGEGYMVSAALALLGLLIAFTFSLAVSRFDARRELVVNEANAIGTAWLRAGLVAGEQGAQLQASIARYADVRLGLSNGRDPVAVERDTAGAQRIVWDGLGKAVGAAPAPVATTMINAANAMFDAASSRKAEREAKIPARVLEVLVLYAIMAAGVVGYVMSATGRRHGVVTTIVFMLLALAITLILDLDRPRAGSVLVSQQPMLDVRAAMR